MYRVQLSYIREQLGEPRLEPVITTDIAGKPDAHSIILDKEAVDAIKKARLHRKVATAIFFESNGGQSRTDATMPEIRLAVAEPGLDLGNIETVLETLGESCYYLRVERNHYRFGLTVTLNKILADRRATISEKKIDERARAEIQKVFATVSGIEKVFFPDKSGQIPDRAALTIIILPPEQAISEGKKITDMIEAFTRENGTSARTFKSALIWIVPDSSSGLYEDARKLLAWEDISDEAEELHLDDIQKRHLDENIKKSLRDLKESVWRTYNNIILLGKDNKMRHTPLGLVHSSAADSLVGLIINRLRQDGDIEEAISPNFLIRNWPPAFKEWSTKSVRDAFFSSPQFPRLINAEAIRDTISRGVSGSNIGYVGKTGNGDYSPFIYGNSLAASDVEITDNIFIIKKEVAEDYKAAKETGSESKKPGGFQYPPVKIPIITIQEPGKGDEQPTPPETNITSVVTSSKLTWNGNVPPQKWMNFYTKVLSKFAGGKGLKLTLSVEVAEEGGISTQKIEETKAALRELGLDDNVSNE